MGSRIDEYNETSEAEISEVNMPVFYGYEIIESGGITYIEVDLSQEINGTRAYSKQYSTVVNGYLIKIVIKSYSGKVMASDMVDFDRCVNSILFDEIKEKPSFRIKDLMESEGGISTWLLMGMGFLLVGYSLLRMQVKKKKKK